MCIYDHVSLKSSCIKTSTYKFAKKVKYTFYLKYIYRGKSWHLLDKCEKRDTATKAIGDVTWYGAKELRFACRVTKKNKQI